MTPGPKSPGCRIDDFAGSLKTEFSNRPKHCIESIVSLFQPTPVIITRSEDVGLTTPSISDS